MKMKAASGFLIILLVLGGCSKKPNEIENPGDYRYIVFENPMDHPFALRIYYSSTAIAFRQDTLALAPDTVMGAGVFSAGNYSGPLVDSIIILDSAMTDTYKTCRTITFIESNDTMIWELDLPPLSAKSVIKGIAGPIYLVDDIWLGFIPDGGNYGGQKSFSTNDGFRTFSYNGMGSDHVSWVISKIIGDTIYAHNDGVYTDRPELRRSVDTGRTWETVLQYSSSAHGLDNLGVSVLDTDNIWYFKYDDWELTRIFRADAGEISQLRGFCIQQAEFVSSDTGYAIANTNDNVTPSTAQDVYFLQTADGGVTWEAGQISGDERPKKLYLLDRNTFIIVTKPSSGTPAYFYKTVDRGVTWERITTGTGGFKDICFISGTTGYLKTGEHAIWSSYNLGDVYKTTDAGISWFKVNSVSQYGARISFNDEMNGWMQDLIYSSGTVLVRTRDEGVTWEEVLYPYDYFNDEPW